MKQGYLSEYFDEVAAKILSAVEADTITSNQHEFNGVNGLRKILGEPEDRVEYKAKLMYLNDQDDEPIVEDSILTWYDARQKARKERGVMRCEYRLYFRTTNVSLKAAAGDLLVISKLRNGNLLLIIAENGSSIASQIEWLFGFSGSFLRSGFSVKSELETERDRIGFASRFILESIGIVVDISDENYLGIMIEKFNSKFPATRIFSAYARSTLQELDPREDPDIVLMAWMEREEMLFRSFENHIIADRLVDGFYDGNSRNVDVDGFISFSLSVQNRRKSRVGLALENHLEELFKSNGLSYERNAVTENKSKPDFLFPGSKPYHDPGFDSLKLAMLGVKSTCKDRWRQVLAEADRIKNKHLLTMESSISPHQTNEMMAKHLQLVIPRALHKTYTSNQQAWLMDLTEFIHMVRSRQDT